MTASRDAGRLPTADPAVTPTRTRFLPTIVPTDVERARDAVRRASDAADGEVQEQLNSIEESLAEFTAGSVDAPDHPDRVAEIERKLDALAEEKVEDETLADAITDARDHLDAVRTDLD